VIPAAPRLRQSQNWTPIDSSEGDYGAGTFVRADFPAVARVLAPGGQVVLSGLLAGQAQAAIAAYGAQGLEFEARIPLDEWVTLVLRRRHVGR
jgi:hypothetical protein